MAIYRWLRDFASKTKSYHISTYAASASFFLMTSLLPLLMLVLSVFSWVGLDIDPGLIAGLSRLIPESLQSILNFVVQSLREVGAAELSISVIALLWAAAKGMIGLVDGLNNIAGNKDEQSFVFKRLLCIVYMVVLIAGLLLTLGLRVFGNAILALLQKYLPYVGIIFADIMDFRGITLYLIITLIIALIYAFFPNKKLPFIKQLPGAALAAAAWLIFSAVYSIYTRYAASTSAIYGGMGVAIFAMLWIYFCIYIIFIGAVVNRLYPDAIGRLLGRLKTRFHNITAKKD